MSVVKVLGLLATCVALVASLTKVDLPTEGTGDLPKTLKTLLLRCEQTLAKLGGLPAT